MKLALITRWWKKSNGGGIREYNVHLIKHLENLGVKTCVLFMYGVDKNNFKLPEKKIKFILKAKRILLKERPDVILCEKSWFNELPAIMYKKRYKKTKIFNLFHTSYFTKILFHRRYFFNYLLKKFDKIGFVSESLKKNVSDVANLKIKTNTFILHAGVEIKQPLRSEIDDFINKYKISNERLYLLGLGLTSLYEKKEGVKLLLRAIKEIKHEFPNISLILTRKGEYYLELEKFILNNNLSENAFLIGDIENPIIALSISDIYTHIVLGEGGVSIAILEAMALEKPIIASNVGGIPEAIDHSINGLLVENNVEEIKNALLKAIRDKKLREELGKNARYKSENSFSWETTAKKLLKIIE